MKRKLPAGTYVVSVHYEPSQRNPGAWWNSFINNRKIRLDEPTSIKKLIKELLEEEGVLNKDISLKTAIYRDPDAVQVGWCIPVYTEEYRTGKKLYFEAWIEMWACQPIGTILEGGK